MGRSTLSLSRFLAPVLMLGMLVLSAGCAEKTKPVPELTFAHDSKILLNVSGVDITSIYRSSGAPPNIEQTLTPTPQDAMILWAQQRLRSVGSTNTARFTILNAPVTAEPLPKSSGFVGAFSVEPGQRWTVTVEAQLEILDADGNRLDGYSTKVTRSRDIESGLTYEQRNRFWYDLLSATMDEFDSQMEDGIRQHAVRWMH